MPTYEDFREFTARQACEFEWLDGKAHFKNGGLSDGHVMHIEPPTEPQALVQAQRMFLRAKIHRLVGLYNKEKQSCATQAEWHRLGAGPAPDENWIRDLKYWAEEIDALQKELAALTEQTPVVQAPNAIAARRDAERQAARNTINAIASLPKFKSPFANSDM
jgi:hypothetical protein